MAKVKQMLHFELDPADPVGEICAVIMAITRPQDEQRVLTELKKQIDARLEKIEKGEEQRGRNQRGR